MQEWKHKSNHAVITATESADITTLLELSHLQSIEAMLR